MQEMRQWYSTPLGQALEAEELAALRECLLTLFGYHLLLVNAPWAADPLDASRIPHRIRLGHSVDSDGPCGLVGRPEQLPLLSDSLDAIVLPHVLELSADPHQVLREVDRCLIPEGHVLILGFNPLGSWGLRRLFGGWRGSAPWCGRFIGVGRLRDWLALLGFDTLEVRPLCFQPPLQHPVLLRHGRFLERLAARGWPLPAAAYLLLARKRVIGMTPLRPRWRPRRSLLSPGVIEPTQRSPR
ncbi:methyltransferase domain-containing protein [Thiohalobacter sp. IOR34]|uniref:methyltransferase domain-containing protein n=1 Tax=Thiohalobacter sp. IOR34 TaxID=3057176 RepID=UPI0025B12CD4|nr:methyltransferase domain-containing protein [Thiohalobacter sp. IOR34]WJW74484.1 methyltransferase domain-containing protein [Thiohalobacter sp. IOR34]